MLSAKTVLSGAAGIALLIGAPALAQTQASGQPGQGPKAKDPNRIICEKIQDTGSRVATSKVCMTAQQWEEKRRNDRAYVEDSQQRSLEPNSG
jgi:hypothetical protein